MLEGKMYVRTTIVEAQASQDRDGREGYSVLYPDGYESWCPKEAFEKAARPLSSEEIAAVKTFATFAKSQGGK